MRHLISKTVDEAGNTILSRTSIPSSPSEIVEHLRENVCVNEKGRRCLPTRVDDDVFDAAANLIERLQEEREYAIRWANKAVDDVKAEARADLLIAKNALQNEARRAGPLTVDEIAEVFRRLDVIFKDRTESA